MAKNLPVDPLQELLSAERLHWLRPYWPERELLAVFGHAARDEAFAQLLCEAVARLAATSDELTQVLRKELGAERYGRPSGRKASRMIDREDGRLLTAYYFARLSVAPKIARARAAETLGLAISDESMKNKLTTARSRIPLERLGAHLHDIAAPDYKSHSRKTIR